MTTIPRERHALVTGGSRGIGRAIVLRFLADGMSVSTCARTPDAFAELSSLAGNDSRRLNVAVVDVADPNALRDWTSQRGEAHGSLDIVVSSASAMAAPVDPWRASIDTDLNAFVNLVETTVPYLERGENAAIVALGTTAAVEAFGRNPASPYGAVKAAVIHHALSLARTLAPKGIRSNVVSPGPVLFPGGAWDMLRRTNPDFFDTVVATIPRGKMATPEEVAHAVAFLASGQAANITGINLISDGGMTQRINY